MNKEQRYTFLFSRDKEQSYQTNGDRERRKNYVALHDRGAGVKEMRFEECEKKNIV